VIVFLQIIIQAAEPSHQVMKDVSKLLRVKLKDDNLLLGGLALVQDPIRSTFSRSSSTAIAF
jgi:hypothetical protein